jgi:hypothetical protein
MEEIVEIYETAGKKYRIVVVRVDNYYDIKDFKNNRFSGSFCNLTEDEYKAEIQQRLLSAKEIDGINYKRIQ